MKLIKLLFFALFLAINANANTEEPLHFIGKIKEDFSDHTTKHEHQLQIVRVDDGEVFDIVDSPALLKEHCKSEINSVLEVSGKLTDKFLFWGGNLVVSDFKVHEDIVIPKIAHVAREKLHINHNHFRSSGTRSGPAGRRR